MTVKELIQNLQAADDMEKEACVDINGIRYTLQNRLLGYDNHVDIIADERYKGNDFLTLIIRFVKVRYSMKEFIEKLIGRLEVNSFPLTFNFETESYLKYNKVKEIVVPSPSSLLALMVPPWSSTICLTIASPRPEPPFPVFLEVSPL